MIKKTNEEDWPTLSIKERDRRWELARTMMAAKGLDCLLVTSDGYNVYDGWLSNDGSGGIVVFPLKGEPTNIVRRTVHGIMAMEVNRKRGILPWIDDVQSWGPLGEGLVHILKQKGLESGNIGTVGLGGGHVGVSGGLAYPVWSYVLQNLPKATFTDVLVPSFVEMIIVKSEEEILAARRAAYAGERACEAMLRTIKQGVTENIIYGNIVHAIITNGAFVNLIITHTGTGFHSFGWGWPMWTYRGQRPPVVEKGDLVQAELFPFYGGMQAQQQMSVATKPVSSLIRELAGVARKSYEAGIKAIKPGVKFGDIYDIMKKPLDDAGCWLLTPLLHTLNPLAVVSPSQTNLEALPELKRYRVDPVTPITPWAKNFVLKAGMTLELEPNACRDNQRVNMGGTILVTENGVEELNTLSTHLNIK